MPSSHSSEVSSTYTHPNTNNNTQNGCSSLSVQKTISPRLRRSSSNVSQRASSIVHYRDGINKGKIESDEKVPKKIRRTTNGTDLISTNSKDIKRSLSVDNSIAGCSPAKNHLRLPSKSRYEKMLKLSQDVGSIEEGRRLFEILIRPTQVTEFMKNYWEKQPLYVPRKCPDFYKDLLSSAGIDRMLRENHLEYEKDIDVQFRDGQEDIGLVGRALPPSIWHYYKGGATIKILNPANVLPAIHSTNETLQEYFHCMIDSSVYLCSKNSEGYAPRCDDSEIFILQIEGERNYRVFKPTMRSMMLSHESKNVDPKLFLGSAVLDVTLRAGDLLYLPRGYIHDMTIDSHSLHLTLRLNRKQTFGDLMEVLMPMLLKEAIKDDMILRRGLPLNIWHNMGIVYSDSYTSERNRIISKIKACFSAIGRHLSNEQILDNAVDIMASKYQHKALPPKLTPEEEQRSVYGTKLSFGDDGSPEYSYIQLETPIRLIRGNVVRMLIHDNGIRVYYSSENSKDNNGFLENYQEIDPSEAPAIEVLIKTYPSYITPSELQLESNDQNLIVAQNLWERGILMTNVPLV